MYSAGLAGVRLYTGRGRCRGSRHYSNIPVMLTLLGGLVADSTLLPMSNSIADPVRRISMCVRKSRKLLLPFFVTGLTGVGLYTRGRGGCRQRNYACVPVVVLLVDVAVARLAEIPMTRAVSVELGRAFVPKCLNVRVLFFFAAVATGVYRITLFGTRRRDCRSLFILMLMLSAGKQKTRCYRYNGGAE